jgi:hypothetical protein
MTHRRGTSNSATRGNSKDRAARRAYLLTTFGDGVTCQCHTCPAVLDDSTITVDRIVPGVLGGSYFDKTNLLPQCHPCSRKQGATVAALMKRIAPLMAQHLTDAQMKALLALKTNGGNIHTAKLAVHGATERTMKALVVRSLARQENAGRPTKDRYIITDAGRGWLVQAMDAEKRRTR